MAIETQAGFSIDGCTHWVLEDHKGIQIAIMKILGGSDPILFRCIWVRKGGGYTRNQETGFPIQHVLSQAPIYPGGPRLRPVGDIEDLFFQLQDEYQR